MRPSFPVLWPALAFALSACAGPVPTEGQPVQWRLQVRTVDEWSDPARLSERVAQVAGVPVAPEASAIAPRWYAITLQCPDRASCKRAAMRLAAQPTLFAELRRDEARRVPVRPSTDSRQ